MNLIVAVDPNNAIGKDNQLLDHFHSDMLHFKKLTLNKVVVMGKNTYLSLPKRPLSDRINIVLSSTMEKSDDYILCRNIEELFELLDNYNDNDIFVIGGSKIYSLLYPYCNTFYITRILKIYDDANKFFSEMKEIKTFIINKWNSVTENGVILDFLEYKRDV